MKCLRHAAIGLVVAAGCRASCEPKAASDAVAAAEATCPSTVFVSVAYPGASPEEVEAGVVIAIEEAVSGIPSVKAVTSRVVEGAGSVVVEVAHESGDDSLRAVKDAVDAIVSFPADVERPRVFAPANQGSYLVVAEDRRRLEGATTMLGDPGRTIVIEADPGRLRAYGIDLEAVTGAIRSGQLRIGGGGIESLGETVVWTSPDGTAISVGDVATIRDTTTPLPRAYRGDASVVVARVAVRDGSVAPEWEGTLDVLTDSACGTAGPSLVFVTAGLPPGTEPSQLDAAGRRLAVEVAKVDPRAVTIVGDRSDASGSGPGDTLIEIIAPAGEDPEAAAARLAAVVGAMPGMALVDVSGVSSSVTLDVVHDDHQTRRRTVEAILAVAQSREGTFAGTPLWEGKPEISAKLSDRGRSLGFTQVQLAQQMRQHMFGTEVARFQDGRDEVPVRLHLAGQATTVESMSVQTPSGDAVPLREVAEIQRSVGSAMVTRRDRKRATPVVVFGPGAREAAPAVIEAGEAAATGVSVRRR